MVCGKNEGTAIERWKGMEKSVTVFIDLQGTLGGDSMGDIRDFYFYPFAVDAIKLLNRSGILAIVVTNQSRIAKGYLTLEEYESKLKQIKEELQAQGAGLDGFYCCPHAKEDRCSCKKPLTGLVQQAQQDFAIDLEHSFVVGDMGNSDMLLSHHLGIRGILVRTGAGEDSWTTYRHTWEAAEPCFVAQDILEAAEYIVQHQK